MSNYSGIVAVIIVIVAAVFLLAWAVVHRLDGGPVDGAPTEQLSTRDAGQGQYMREVRMRHQNDLAVVNHDRKYALVSGVHSEGRCVE